MRIKKKIEKQMANLAKKNGGMPKSSIPKKTFKEIVKKEGGMTGVSLDAHCWCELNGEIVFDPEYPKEEQITKDLFNLTDKKCYKKFDPLLQTLCWRAIKPNMDSYIEYLQSEAKVKCDEMMAEDKTGENKWGDAVPRPLNETEISILLMETIPEWYGNCFLIARAYKHLNPEVELVCGSAGWVGYDGVPHYEYG